jgi:hypothetical protein
MIIPMIRSFILRVRAFIVSLVCRCVGNDDPELVATLRRNAETAETSRRDAAERLADYERGVALRYRVKRDFTVMPRTVSARRSIQLSWSRRTPPTYLVGDDGFWRYVQTRAEMDPGDAVTLPATGDDRDDNFF